ncbi:putative bifunctional diguanylate cyclase/phosphodiesterase [Coralloluteibacterium stylophorae]|uniref:cyclic-guanylate-specific phosphodiesterase n=3 Tax=Coralloluteibacterium stylophorae TaxID=1776034 RepID=A0AAP2CCL2_9GAMM|nr:EAL domain-containing protein [Coralloluteibacterium stylophorae]
MTSTYQTPLVLVSIAIAVLASYTALDMASRVAASRGRVRLAWLAGGGFAMGVGVWSMHFVGMLAFRLPIEVGYDPAITALSFLLAVAASTYALHLVSAERLARRRLAVGMLVMGAGIAGMHYGGMAAMRMLPGIVYDPLLFVLSVAIAVGASGAALWIAFRLRTAVHRARLLRGGAAVLMGAAIAGMHYTGMAAAGFPAGSVCGAATVGIDAGWLAAVVVAMTLAVIAVALSSSSIDARIARRTDQLSRSLAEVNAELVHRALHDPLTRLPNRVLLEDRIGQAVCKAARGNGRFAVLFVDLDGFKAVNDAWGHQFGDGLLVEVAARLRAARRSTDTLARLGGDEFVLLIDIAEPADAATVAEDVLRALAAQFEVAGHPLRIGASIGIAIYPEDGAGAQALMANADAAMYHAKDAGRGAFRFFEPRMNANARRQLQLVQDLRAALEKGQFVLHYQPRFASVGGALLGAEALIRWRHPERGLLAPAEFIPAAERTGLIVPIGEWVLEEACRQITAWSGAGQEAWVVSVNLSALQFAHARLVETVRGALARHEVPAHRLMLEITETTAMHDIEASCEVLAALTGLGVGISIDDFGTGYSSLLHLKRLPANELKIDRGFVGDLARDSDDAAIVSAIVALGRTLGLRIVAEGVETDAQRSFLTEVGCDSLQGFFLGRPVPAERFAETVATQVPIDG